MECQEPVDFVALEAANDHVTVNDQIKSPKRRPIENMMINFAVADWFVHYVGLILQVQEGKFEIKISWSYLQTMRNLVTWGTSAGHFAPSQLYLRRRTQTISIYIFN